MGIRQDAVQSALPRSKTAPKGIDHDQTVALRKKGLTTLEIAAIQGCDPSNITRALQRYGISAPIVNEYKEHRADILAGLQQQIIQNITLGKLQKASGYQLTGMLGILYDKERLERGQSTDNISVRSLMFNAQEVREEINRYQALRQQLEGARG